MNNESKTVNNNPPPKKSNCRTCGIIIGVIILISILYFVFTWGLPFLSNNSSNNEEIPIPVSSTSAPQTSVSNIPKDDILDFFVEATTYQGKMIDKKPLARWTKNPITIELNGEINDVVISSIDKIIASFNAISDIKLQRVSSGGDIQIFIVPKSQFPAISIPDDSFKGVSYTDPDANCVINSSKIYMDTEDLIGAGSISSEDRFSTVLRHELMHSFGFSGHDTKPRGCTSLSKIACLIKDFTQYDISAIKMLYNSGIPLCSDETTIRNFFGNNIPL